MGKTNPTVTVLQKISGIFDPARLKHPPLQGGVPRCQSPVARVLLPASGSRRGQVSQRQRRCVPEPEDWPRNEAYPGDTNLPPIGPYLPGRCAISG